MWYSFSLGVWGLGLMAGVEAAPRLAFVANVPVHSYSPDAAIFTVGADGRNAVNVSEGLAAARSPAWAPDGRWLAFEAIEQGHSDIFICDAEGRQRRNATASPEVWEAAPAFVGGADRLAYLAGPDRTEVWVIDVGGGTKVRLTPQPRFHSRPVPSPNGKFLVVVASEKLGGPGDLYQLDLKGGKPRNLTNAPAVYSPPCFSPDGQTLAFAFDGRDIGGATRGLATMPVAGGEPRLLAADGYPYGALCYSPDGTKIAYTSASVYHATWVTILNADGTDPQRLNVQPFHLIAGPSFSPDGEWLAYYGVYAAVFTVHVCRLDGSEDRAVTAPGQTGVQPVFAGR